jgi:tripeptidyl-peptidase I
VSDPDHARYGQHLSKAEVDELIKPSIDASKLVAEWLADNGIEEKQCDFSGARDFISVPLTVEEVERLLDTTYSIYEHEDGTRLVRAPEWSLPEHLHEHIATIQPTTAFLRANPHGVEAKRSTDVKAVPGYFKPPAKVKAENLTGIAALCNFSAVTPDCLRTLYDTIDYVPQVPGKNKIGLNDFLGETNNRSDTEIFLQTFRPDAASAAYTFSQVSIAGGTVQQTPNDTVGLEGNLDIETILGIAYPTPATAYSTGGSPPFIEDVNTPTDTNEPYMAWVLWALAQKSLPQVISTSYGDDEQTVPYSYAMSVCNGFAQLGVQGVSLIFSSGDSGVGSDGTCVSNIDNSTMFLPEFPASCPYVTTVGGTKDFPEVVGLDARNGYVSGGGFSNYFARPSYQNKVVPAYIKGLDSSFYPYFNKSGRGYPDIAAQSYHFLTIWNGSLVPLDGTSCAAPTASSVLSLVNDALLAAGKPVLGFLNPWLYKRGYQAFTDVVKGSAVGCNETGLDGGFPATEGWDAVTGFGTPSFLRILEQAADNW